MRAQLDIVKVKMTRFLDNEYLPPLERSTIYNIFESDYVAAKAILLKAVTKSLISPSPSSISFCQNTLKITDLNKFLKDIGMYFLK